MKSVTQPDWRFHHALIGKQSKHCDKIAQQFLADTVYYYFSLFLQNNY